jgi:Flp pilus assembly protein TadD
MTEPAREPHRAKGDKPAFTQGNTPMNRFVAVGVALSFVLVASASTQAQTAEEWYTQGVGYLNARQFEKAVHAFTKAIELNPQDEFSLMARGGCYMMSNRFSEAIRDFTRVIELNPQSSSAYLNRGQVHRIRGDLEEATADLVTAARLGDKSAQDILTEAGIPW